MEQRSSTRKYIGAGIACLGMGGAGIGLGSLFGNYLAGAIRNPAAADGPVRPPDLRLRRDRGARHLLAADRAPADLRRLTPDADARTALAPLSRKALPVISRQLSLCPDRGARRAGTPAVPGTEAPAPARASQLPALRSVHFRLAALLAGDLLRRALRADEPGRVAAHRLDPGGAEPARRAATWPTPAG